MRKVVIIGYGNSLRQDDGLACIALEHLQRAGLTGDIEFVATRQLLPEHAAIASQADLLIFVDASQHGSSEIRIQSVKAGGKFPSPSHYLSPEALLKLVQEVYGAEPEAYLATLPGLCFELGEGVTPETKRLIPQLVSEISKLVEQQVHA